MIINWGTFFSSLMLPVEMFKNPREMYVARLKDQVGNDCVDLFHGEG